MKKLVTLMVVLGMLVSPIHGSALAGSAWTEADSYLGKTGGKFMFGLKNLTLGWLDIFYEPHKWQNTEGNPLWSNAFGGLVNGLIDAPMNMVGGALHLVTFPIPLDIPLPDGGIDLTPASSPETMPEDFKVNQYQRNNP